MFAKFAAAVVAAVKQTGIMDASLFKDATPEATIPVPNISYPGDNCCILYKDPNYSGEALTKCHNGGTAVFDLSGTHWND